MNLHNAWDQREKLNEKMSALLLQGLKSQLVDYHRVVANYPPERMEKYGTPFIKMLEEKIATVEAMIQRKFPK